MATKAKALPRKSHKPAAKAPAKKATAAKPAVKPAAKKVVAAKKVAAPKAIKAALNKTQLIAYLVEQSGVEAKSVKAVLASLETSVLGSVDKKGAGEFTLPGLFKVPCRRFPPRPSASAGSVHRRRALVPAKPASVKVKVRPLKKLKDAAQYFRAVSGQERPAPRKRRASLRDAPLHEARRLVRIYLHIKILYLKTNRAHHSSPAEPRPSPARTGAPTGRKATSPTMPQTDFVDLVLSQWTAECPGQDSRPWR